MGILKRRHKSQQSDDYMWLSPHRVEQPPSAPPAEVPAPAPPSVVPPPPIPVEVTSEPEDGRSSA